MWSWPTRAALKPSPIWQRRQALNRCRFPKCRAGATWWSSPFRKAKSLTCPRGLFKDAPANLIVIDTGNYYPRHRDGQIEGIENGLLESRWVEQQLGHPVIKVFNNIYAEHLAKRGKPPGTPGRIALPVSGDDAKAKEVVMKLVNDIGFDPVDAGGLDESWRQQPATPVYAADFDAAGVRRALAQATPERKPEWRATPKSPGTFDAPA